ncbi:MAG: DUF1156 domain-containing protein [Elusimicrobia bacterium]|nr:DUF1156 domain-containing protein [Elusimicrobiota bacterium]MDE2424440.1 DUF1156 domain-containing protein [Elusimicrobiota bacterium]
MIPKECKRIAEVDFPIAAVSSHAGREKSIRHGHPSTLHLWWARRPLAACRSMLLALLLPDPADRNCPAVLKEHFRRIIKKVLGHAGDSDEQLRAALLKFIGNIASWDLSSNPTYIEAARELIAVCYDGNSPLVVDPFAGGGAIPLEGLRLGCESAASDLNPVASLIQRVMLEDIPRRGPRLIDEIDEVTSTVKKAAETKLAEYYPVDKDGSRPIAYLWARTIRCEEPGCGAEIPLLKSLWLCKKAGRRRAIKPTVVPGKHGPTIEFEIIEPKSEGAVGGGTVSRAKAVCIANNRHVVSPDRVRAQLREQRGGADVVFDKSGRRIGGATLIAVVTVRPDSPGRHYRLATSQDYDAIYRAQRATAAMSAKRAPNGSPPFPDEPLPPQGSLGFRVQLYGAQSWGDLFAARQKLALATFCAEIRSLTVNQKVFALALGKMADLSNALCPWEPVAECPRQVLTQGRLKPSWGFAESVPISESSGGFGVCVENLIAGIRSVQNLSGPGQVHLAPAQQSPLPDASAAVWFTDPPYYDAIPYATLSDFFFVWFKRALPESKILRDPLDPNNPLTPKRLEAISDPKQSFDGRPKDKAFFEATMAEAFKEGRRILSDDGIGSVVFAHKTTEGWEALLSGLIRGGWVVTASWPIATEMAHRLRARDSAALATSVHLVCRPRPSDAGIGDWADVLKDLPRRVGSWIERLQSEGVRGADLVFACIGPALEIFSQYEHVEAADGRIVTLGEYLEKVWEVVGRTALGQILGTAEAKARNGDAGAVEEDARLTALFLWTLENTNQNSAVEPAAEEDGTSEPDDDDEEESSAQSKGGFSLSYDVVRRFAQPLGIHLPEWEGRILETDKGVVRLLSIGERSTRLFGKGGVTAASDRLSKKGDANQFMLFPDSNNESVDVAREAKNGAAGPKSPRKNGEHRLSREATTLDKVHAAMVFQAEGQASALKALIRTEIERGPGFLRLSNALAALYPRGTEERRLLEAMLLAVPK